MDDLADAWKSINNAHTKKMRHRPSSSQAVLHSHHLFLTVMMKHGYIANLKSSLDHRAGEIFMNLSNTLRKVWVKQVWSPRLDVQLKDLEKRQYHLLPARLFGVIVLIDDLRWHHDERTQEKKKILGFFSRDVIHTYKVSQNARERGREPSRVSCLPAAAESLPGHWTGRN